MTTTIIPVQDSTSTIAAGHGTSGTTAFAVTGSHAGVDTGSITKTGMDIRAGTMAITAIIAAADIAMIASTAGTATTGATAVTGMSAMVTMTGERSAESGADRATALLTGWFARRQKLLRGERLVKSAANTRPRAATGNRWRHGASRSLPSQAGHRVPTSLRDRWKSAA